MSRRTFQTRLTRSTPLVLTAWAADARAMDMHSPTVRMFAPEHALGLGIGLLAIAALVNRFVPEKRVRLRPTVLLFGLYVVALVTRGGFYLLHWPSQTAFASFLTDFVELLLVINLASLAIFDLGLRAVRVAVANILSDLAIGFAYIVALLHSLHGAGVNLSGIIATSAVVSGVLGLSLAPTLGNILGGVALQLDNSIREGDWIQLDASTQGRVKSIRWRHTVVETRNWDTIIVPNATLLSSSITILGKRTAEPVQRRYWVYFNVDFRFDPARVIQAVEAALRAHPIPNVAAQPPPNCICMDLARDQRDSFAYYAVRYWLTDLAVDDPTSSVVRERIVAALARAEIPLAIPGQTLTIQTDAARDAERDVAEHGRRIDLLRRLALFHDLTEAERESVAQHLTYAPFARGEVMTQQGRAAHWLYILARGSAEVVVSVDDRPPERVGELVAPDFFGEIGMMTGAPRSATVIAREPCECYRLDKDGFESVMRARKELAALLSQTLARRRSELDAVRENLNDEQKSQRMADQQVRLLSQIELFFGLGEQPRADRRS